MRMRSRQPRFCQMPIPKALAGSPRGLGPIRPRPCAWIRTTRLAGPAASPLRVASATRSGFVKARQPASRLGPATLSAADGAGGQGGGRVPQRADFEVSERRAEATTQPSGARCRRQRQTARGGGIGPSVSRGLGNAPSQAFPSGFIFGSGSGHLVGPPQQDASSVLGTCGPVTAHRLDVAGAYRRRDLLPFGRRIAAERCRKPE